MLPVKQIYTETRFKSSDSASDSDPTTDLPTTPLTPDDAGLYVYDVRIPHMWFPIETDVSDKLLFKLNLRHHSCCDDSRW